MKFKYFSLLIISITYVCVESIHGGGYYPITEVPYQVQLNTFEDDGSRTFCGATLISEYWIVTAAHCVFRDNVTRKIQIGIGTSTIIERGIVINVSDIVVHEKYTTEPQAYDISLVKAEKEIEFNKYHYPIFLSRVSPKSGDEVTVSGYGYSHYGMFEQVLKIKRLHVIDDEACFNRTIGKTQFCTDVKEADLCFGDSGGPAVLNDKLVGVASDGCEYTAPVVFIKISEFYDWIINVTGIEYEESD